MMRAMYRRPEIKTLASCVAILFLMGGLSLMGCQSEPADRLDEIRKLQSSGRIQDSIDPLTEMIEDGDMRSETLYRYGRALSVTGQPGRAVWALDAALADPAWFVHASHQLALNASNSGNHDLALEVLHRLRDEREDDHTEDIPARLLEVRVLIATRRNPEQALEQIEIFLDDYPENEEAIRLKAVALLGVGETDEAYELIHEAGIQLVEADDASGSDETEVAETADDDPVDLVETTALNTPPVPHIEEDETEEGFDPKVAAEEARDRYWCTVRATFKREAGELEEALEIVNDCIEKHPTSIEVLNEAVEIYVKTRQYDRILEVLRAAVDGMPENRNLRNSLVDHLSNIGRPEEAEAVMREALELALEADPPKPIRAATIWVDLAGHLIENDRLDESLDAYKEALGLLGDQASADLHFRYADALILAKRFDEAIETIKDSPVEVYPPMIRGRVAFERQDYATAVEELDRVALLWPDNAPTRYYLARSAEGTGDLDRAVEEYRQAMRSDPFLHEARERLIRLHLAEGRVRDAQTIHRFNSPKRGRASPSLQMKILQIEIQTRLGNEPDLSVTPDSETPRRTVQALAVDALRRGLALRGGPEFAVKTLERLESKVEPNTRDLFAKAQVDILLEDEATWGRALEVARRTQAALPDRPMPSLQLARAQVRNGVELDDAKRRLDAVIDANDAQADALASLGELAVKQGDLEGAIRFFDRAIDDTQDHWIAVSGKAEALTRLGRSDEATRTLEAYLKSANPYDGKAVLALARRLPDAEKSRRVALAHRAIRFGGGTQALDFLAEIEPEEAKRYRVETVVEAGDSPSETDAG